MHRFRNKSLYLVLAPLLFAGCASTSVTVPELASAHPANPDAPTAPLMWMSQTLQSSEISKTPSDDQPAAGMEGMDHGSMKVMGGMNDGAAPTGKEGGQ